MLLFLLLLVGGRGGAEACSDCSAPASQSRDLNTQNIAALNPVIDSIIGK